MLSRPERVWNTINVQKPPQKSEGKKPWQKFTNVYKKLGTWEKKVLRGKWNENSGKNKKLWNVLRTCLTITGQTFQSWVLNATRDDLLNVTHTSLRVRKLFHSVSPWCFLHPYMYLQSLPLLSLSTPILLYSLIPPNLLPHFLLPLSFSL